MRTQKIQGTIACVRLDCDPEQVVTQYIPAHRGSCILSFDDATSGVWCFFSMRHREAGTIIIKIVPPGDVLDGPPLYPERLLGAFTRDGVRYHVFAPPRQ